jgi:hypothetical protein
MPLSYAIRLDWQLPDDRVVTYHVYRRKAGAGAFQRLTPTPISQASYSDVGVETRVPYEYTIRAVSRRGLESEPSPPSTMSATITRDPVFLANFDGAATGMLYGGETVLGKLHGKARLIRGVLDLREGGHATFSHRPQFALEQPIAVECWLRFEQLGGMPVIVSCGQWHQAGWFLQQLGGTWRWHVGGIDCDGGQPPVGRWVHMVGVYDGRTAQLYQDGVRVAERAGAAVTVPWRGELHVGQYSTPAPPYQVLGQIAGLKIYHRPLEPAEIAAAAKAPPAK